MKHQVRIALPPLADLAPDSLIPFAVLDRRQRVVRSGELRLDQLSANLPQRSVHAILHPGDAVVVEVDVPPLPDSRLQAAVEARVEPLALSELSTLCIAHGARRADGKMQVAWAGRQPLLAGWQLLDKAGLDVRALVPCELALPQNDLAPQTQLALPADERWQAPLPKWSLARADLGPRRQASHWRSAIVWVAAATLLWTVGLRLHAVQLRSEAQTLRSSMEAKVRSTFPSIPVILDPLQQAHAQLANLRQGNSAQSADRFLPLVLEAARLLGFASGHVVGLKYGQGALTLQLAEGYQPPADESSLQQAAARAGLRLEKDADLSHVWHVSWPDAPSSPGGQQ